MPKRIDTSLFARRIFIGVVLPATLCLSAPLSVGAQSQSDILKEKDLEIRNLRRRIFDLESQLPTTGRQDRQQQEMERLKAQRREDVSKLESEYEERLQALNDRIRDLQNELKALNQSFSDGEKASAKEIEAKDRQLLRSNEMLTKAMAERTALQERFDKLSRDMDSLTSEHSRLQKEAADRQKSRKRLIAKTEKPLQEKISRLEEELKTQSAEYEKRIRQLTTEQAQRQKEFDRERDEWQQQVREVTDTFRENERRWKDLEKQNGDDLQQSQKRIADLEDELRRRELGLKQSAAAVSELEKERADLVKAHKEVKAALETVSKQKASVLSDERAKQEELLQNWQKKITGLNKELTQTQEQLKKQAADHERQQAQWKKDLAEKEALVRAVDDRIAQTTRPLREEVKIKEDALDQLRMQLKAGREKQELLSGQLQDKDDKIAVYQKLVDKQEDDLKELRRELAKGDKDLERTIAAEKAPLEAKLEELNKELASAKKQLQLRHTDTEKEFDARRQKLQEQISSLQIDLEFQTNKNAKLIEAQGQLEDTLIALQKKNETLQNSVDQLTAQIDRTDEDRLAVRKMREQNAELEKRLEILLQENADYQKKVLELTESVKGITSAEEMARELAEAQDIILGFKKDVDAKTIEISGLVSENQDLRKRLRQSIKDMEDLSGTIQNLKTEKLTRISDEEIGALQEQVNSLRSALSKARQLIAQKDVALNDLQSDRDLLRTDVTRLTDELNSQIKAVGELEYAKRNNFGGYSEDELQAAKKPLLLEISVLKRRVSELEGQLVETWNRAEGMLLELKNHPQIKQANGQLSMEELMPRR